jgi:hypothetical protein
MGVKDWLLTCKVIAGKFTGTAKIWKSRLFQFLKNGWRNILEAFGSCFTLHTKTKYYNETVNPHETLTVTLQILANCRCYLHLKISAIIFQAFQEWEYFPR